MCEWFLAWLLRIVTLLAASVFSTLLFAMLLLDIALTFAMGPCWPQLLQSLMVRCLKLHWMLQAAHGDTLALWSCVLGALGLHCQNFHCCIALTVAITLVVTQAAGKS